MSTSEHETPENARQWLADHYARPQRPRIPDLRYAGGAMQPIEYELAEGSGASGREMVHHVLRRTGTRYDQHMLGVTEQPAPVVVVRHRPPIVPTRSYVNRPSRASARESVALIVAVVLLVGAFLWGAAGMPL